MHIQDSLAPNVIAMIRSFNQLALLVPSEILEETTPQARTKVITSYIQVRQCQYYGYIQNLIDRILAQV